MGFWERIFLTVVHQFANCLSIATIIVFLHCFYDTDFQWKRKNLLYTLGYFLSCVVLDYHLGSGNIYTGILGIVPFYIAVCNYKGRKITGILRFLLAYAVVLCSISCIAVNGAAMLIPGISMKMILAGTPAEFPYSVWIFISILFAVFFGSIFCYLYFFLYKRNIVIQCGVREIILATIYPFLCIGVTVMLFVNESNGPITIYVLSCLSFLMAILFPIFMYFTRINQYYQSLTKSQEYYIQAELAHFMQYKEAQEETARFRHDIRNNLLCVHNIIQNGKSEAALKYLQDLLEITTALGTKYVSGDEMLDAIIGVKTKLMEEKGIQFQLEGVLPGGLQWKAIDICIVFSNALDNAISECEKLPFTERTITLTIKSTAQFWFITITNPTKDAIDTNLLFQKNGGYTSKTDHRLHGLGTYNMKRVTESYGGIMKATCKNNLFALEIMINKSHS